MPKRASAPTHAVIDGSNLATEGRKEPSLAQLREAVDAIREEYDFTHITVIVDASFEHRVAKSEAKEARKAIDANEIITPPAGVIGRGDTFILEVADRANAVVFSNDSFQEFHGTYDWLFDEGRLIGGKPVPGVGWVFVPRTPVRGPVSRRATSKRRRADETPTAAKTPAKSTKSTKSTRSTTRSNEPAEASSPRRSSRRKEPTGQRDGSNPPEAWKTFAHDYPVGTTVAVTVDRFSSHGAYGSVDDVIVYLPNRLLGDPPPTKARDVLEVGSTVDVIVHRFDEERHGIDAGLIPVPGTPTKKPKPRAAGKATKTSTPAKKTTAKKTTAKKTAAKKTAAKKTTAKKTTAKKTAAKKTAAKKTTAKKTTAKKTTAKKTAAKKTAAKTAAKKKAAAATTTRRRPRTT